MAKTDNDQAFIDAHRPAIKAFAEWFDNIRLTREDAKVSSYDKLYAGRNQEQLEVLKRIRAIDPGKYGFKGEFLGAGEVPPVVKYAGQKYRINGKSETIPTQYLPKKVAKAFQSMANAFTKETSRHLLIYCGYRAPDYQLGLIVFWLYKEHSYHLAETLVRVAHPDYSQHCVSDNTAIDITNDDGAISYGSSSKDDEKNIEASVEYKWLKQHAADFDFYESYSKDNPWGVVYEPWHWQYKPTAKA